MRCSHRYCNNETFSARRRDWLPRMKSHLRPNRPHAPVAPRPSFAASAALLGAATAAVAVLAPARPAMADDDSKIRTVFVIAMENHNFTQPNPTSSPQQILGNPAAPYINSLVTPGNPNAAQVSYATKYY